MATTTIKTVEVEKVVKEKEKVFVLELTEQEARAVRTLTGCISGRSEFRDIADKVFWSLDSAGVKRMIVNHSETGLSMGINGWGLEIVGD